MVVSSSTLHSTYSAMESSIGRLSSGSRINTAADDPAGAAVSDQMAADIACLSQRARGAGDKQSLAMTAEAGLAQTSDILVRMRELASQAMSGTLGVGRQFVDAEFQQLSQEVAAQLARTKKAVAAGPAEVQGSLSSLDTAVTALGNSSLDPTTSPTALDDALKAIKELAGQVNGSRADLGIAMEQYSSEAEVAYVQAESLTASYSRIADADVAAEASSLAASSIKMQFAVAMKAHEHFDAALSLKLLSV